MSNIELFNADCMDALREMPDKVYDLAIVDPPYGGGGSMQMMPTTANADGSGSGSTSISATPIKTVRGGGRFERYHHQSRTDGRDMGIEVPRGYL